MNWFEDKLMWFNGMNMILKGRKFSFLVLFMLIIFICISFLIFVYFYFLMCKNEGIGWFLILFLVLIFNDLDWYVLGLIFLVEFL